MKQEQNEKVGIMYSDWENSNTLICATVNLLVQNMVKSPFKNH